MICYRISALFVVFFYEFLAYKIVNCSPKAGKQRGRLGVIFKVLLAVLERIYGFVYLVLACFLAFI